MKHRFSSNLAKDECGIYTIVLACILLGVLIICGFAIDGVKLARANLWAQRAADAAAISGAGRIARDPRAIDAVGVSTFTTQVADVALHNLFVRNVVASDGSIAPAITRIGSTGVVAQSGDAAVRVEVIPGTKRIQVSVSYSNDYLLMDLVTGESFRRVDATASAEVGAALVSLMLDTSYSMRLGTKLEDLRNSVDSFLRFFDPATDRINLIAYATDAVLLQAFNTSSVNGGFNPAAIRSSLAGLTAAGATNPTAALRLAHRQVSDVQSAQGAWYDRSQVAYVFFTDGSPTAGTFDFVEPTTALPQYPSGSGRYEYVSMSGDIGSGPLLPFRLIQNAIPLIGLSRDTDVDSLMLASCSQAVNGYSVGEALTPCLRSLAFRLPNGVIPPAIRSLDAFEPAYQYSAISWADAIRSHPPRPARPLDPLGARVYAIGYGAPVPGACINASTPWDNADGGICADRRKDNFLARLAFDRLKMAEFARPFPNTGIDTEMMSPGLSITAPESPGALERMFRQAAVHLRLRLIS